MKKILGFFFLALMAISLNAADYKQAPPAATGMPGDNLNLYVVLNLFKQATSMEDFERMLNSNDYRANNLDLNNDGSVDYLRVTDYGTGNYHTIIIQDIISASEIQDVAIIDLQKENGNVAHVQIIGDESLYGKNYIIEPQMDNVATTNTTIVNNNYYYNNQPTPVQYVNVWSWPSVNFIFGSVYRPWVSPWHWAYYPTWWNTRPRVIYNVYYSNFNDFGWNHYCRRDNYFNQPYYNNYYSNRRVVSNTVQVNINKNVYKNNYGNNNVDHNNGNHNGYNKPNGNNSNNANIQQGSKPKQGNGENKGNWNKQNTSDVNNNGQSSPKWNKNSENNGTKGNWNSNGQNQQNTNSNTQNSPKWNNNNENNGTKGNWNSNGQNQTKPANTNNGQGSTKWNNNSNNSSNGNWNKGTTTNSGKSQGWNNNSGNKGSGNKSQGGGSQSGVKTGSRGK